MEPKVIEEFLTDETGICKFCGEGCCNCDRCLEIKKDINICSSCATERASKREEKTNENN